MFFLNPENFTQRLRTEWETYGGLILAVDYDSTLVPYWQYEMKDSYEPIQQLIRECKEWGCTIIINTAAAEERHESIKLKLAELNIRWDYFNESPSYIPGIGKGGKVYANVYIDNRGGLWQVYTTLKQLLLERQTILLKKQVKALDRYITKL